MLRLFRQTSPRFSSMLIVLAAVFLLVVPLAAQEDISGSLDIMGFGLGDEIATVRVDQVRATYPNLELNFTEGALDEQQFLTSVASGDPPDLVYLGRDVLSTYAVRGALMPLTECIDTRGIDMSQYRQTAVDQVTVNGEVYGIPEFYNSIMLFINNAALAEAGLSPEDVDTSDWESIRALNDALTRVEDGNVTRIGFDPKLPEFLPLWAMANGASLLSDDGRTAQLNDPRVVEALEFATSLHDAAGGRQPFIAFRDTWDFFGSENQMVADQLGVFPMEQWYMNVLAGSSPDVDITFAPFLDREGNPINFVTGSAWAIPVGSSNPEAACAFMQAITAPEAWVAAAQERADLRTESGAINTGVYTGNSVADEQIFGEVVQPIDVPAFAGGVDTILDVQENGFAVAANPAGSEFRQAWVDAVNRVLNGEQTAQEALDQAQVEAQAALDEAWAASE